MTAIREGWLAAQATLLATVNVAGVTVYRDPDGQVPEEKLPALVLISGGEAIEIETASSKIMRARPVIGGAAEAATPAAAATARETLLAETRRAIEADKTLGGRVMGVIETDADSDTDTEEGHRPIAAFALRLDVLYQTSRTDPDS